jgi:hypothetical protein
MGILFGFKADEVTANVLDTDVNHSGNVVVTTPLTIDPISDAVNNVRFAFNGFAGDGGTAQIEMRTRAFFTFQIPDVSRITVHGHFTFGGLSTVSGRASSWLLDLPGSGLFQASARMRVRVRGPNNEIVFTRTSGERLLFFRFASGTNGSRTVTDIVSAGLLEEFITIAPPDLVAPGDTIFVRLQYNVLASALDGGEFIADFDASGGGLNVPMVVVNY